MKNRPLPVMDRVGGFTKENCKTIEKLIDQAVYCQTPFASIEADFIKKGIDHRCLEYKPKSRKKRKSKTKIDEKPHDYYSKIYMNGKMVYIHRLIYEVFNPDNLSIENYQVDHRCNNRKCMNINHLQRCTGEENINFIHQRKNDEKDYINNVSNKTIDTSNIMFSTEQENIFQGKTKKQKTKLVKNMVFDESTIFDDL